MLIETLNKEKPLTKVKKTNNLIVAQMLFNETFRQKVKVIVNGPNDDDDERGPDGDKIIPGPPKPDGGTYPAILIPEVEKWVPDKIEPLPAPQPPKEVVVIKMGPDDGDEPPAPLEPLNPGEVEKVELPGIETVWIVGTPDGDKILVRPDEPDYKEINLKSQLFRIGPNEDPVDPNEKEPSIEGGTIIIVLPDPKIHTEFDDLPLPPETPSSIPE